MARDLSTAPSKPGERTKKFQQRKHLTSYREVLGDKLRARKMNKKKKSKASGAEEEEDRSHHGHTDGPLFFPQHNNHETDDDDMAPPQLFGNAPNQAPQGAFFGQGQARSHQQQQQQQQQPQFHRMPTMADGRGLQSGEMEAHLQRGGQTEYGERPRGQGPSVYIDTEAPVPRGVRSGGTSSRGQPQHPWEPETRHYEQERTRMR
ncbi:unnamed protein product [Alternaria alternata]